MLPLQADNGENKADKTVCIQAIGYDSLDELKRDLLINAKREAVNELFGELIAASTAVENFVLTSDQIRTSTLGLVRVDGDIDYYNGKNLAEVCVSISTYTTEQDRDKFKPVKLSKRNCITEPDLTTREIKEAAKEQAVIQALLDYDRKLELYKDNDLLKLMQRITYSESGFVPETETYCTRVEGYIIPIEILTLTETLTSPEAQKPLAPGSPSSVEGGITFSDIKVDSIYSKLSKGFYCGNIDSQLCGDFQLIDDEKPTFKKMFNAENVLASHPISEKRPAIFRIAVHEGTFNFRAHSHPRGGSSIKILASGEVILHENVDQGRWQRFSVSIPEGVNEIELQHIATGWYFEHLFFDFGISD